MTSAPQTVRRREVGGEIRQLTGGAAVAVPTWLLLGGIVLLSFLVRFALAVRDPAPWIFQDEIIYSSLARSLAETGHFAIRDVDGAGGFGVLYPIVVSPAYLLYNELAVAYDALRAINALVMSLTAVPVYLLARRLAERWLALAAAALSIAVPSVAYTANVMTENVFYPIFAAWLLATYVALERATVVSQVASLGLIGLAYLTRPQGVVLVPALVAALALTVASDARIEPRGRRVASLKRGLWRFRVTWALLLVGAAGTVALQYARGRSLRGLLGAYSRVTDLPLASRDVAKWLLWHAGALDLAVGIVPFAALIVVVGCAAGSLRHDRPLRVFAALALPTVVTFLYAVAVFAADPVAQRILERNLFYVSAVCFVALAAWIARGAPRPWWIAPPAAALAVALPAAIPYDRFLNSVATHSTMSFLQLSRLEERGVDHITIVVVLVAAVAALAFLLVPRRFAMLLPIVVLLYLLQLNRPAEAYTHRASVEAQVGGVPAQEDWVDRAVGADAHVRTLFYTGSPVLPWESEFFNHSVSSSMTLVRPYDGLPETRVHADRGGFLRDRSGRRVRADYVLTNRWAMLAGARVAADRGRGSVVYRVGGPVQLRTLVEGLYADTWSGPDVRYVRYGCAGGILDLRLTSDPNLHRRPMRMSIATNGIHRRLITIPRAAVGLHVPVPVDARRGRCEIAFVIRPTAVPYKLIGTGDMRALGVRFASMNFHAPSATSR